MARDLILGTAGHIDHGKTSLVKALTGVDCDRLPEEKARGITIDIGFASLDLGDIHLGIVDVPGHERFVKNMLAGATGIDAAMLVVAADDSIMPQTREHLEILKLLGLKHGVIALTKADLVDETTREVVALEIRDLVQGTFLEDAPLIATSAHSGLGIPELREALRDVCRRIDRTVASEWFRMAIDRAFVVQGHGTVVTGSVTSGSVRVGDEVTWHRGDGTSETVRVRSLNNHGQPVDEVHRGQRAAINLAGVPHDAVRRGQELATAGYLLPSTVLTIRLLIPRDAPRAVKHRLPVRVHIGTAEVMGTVSLLDADRIEPGGQGIAQLFLEEPVVAVWNQPLVIRDSSAEHTLGGGQVLQPNAIKLRRRHIESLERVEQLGSGRDSDRVAQSVWFAGYHGLAPADLVRLAGVSPDQTKPIIDNLTQAGTCAELQLPPHRTVLLHGDRIRELEERIRSTVGAMHREFPLMTSHERPKVFARLDYVGDEALLQAIVDRMLKAKQLVGDAKRIALVEFKPKLSINQRKLKDKIVEDFAAAGFSPPDLASFVNRAAGNAAALNDIFEVAVAEGLLVRLSPDLYLHADVEREMLSRVRNRLDQGPGATVAEIRDLLGTTRKFAVPLCEYLDRIGLTKREGDLRVRATPKSD